ncbi:Tyrosine-protein phosphatase non-receptor type 4 [Nymphon striatum]|nr:Tyrosine-protein phosphatase non-receptor type 4 [Nymphon striatum]
MSGGVTHVNSQTNANKDTKVVFKEHEQSKKRGYLERVLEIEHASFTPLVLGTNGGMGTECQKFVSALASKLAEKQNEEYSVCLIAKKSKLSMSRRAFVSGSSGTYNVRASELAREKHIKTIHCTVFFLDESQHTFEIQKQAKGQLLLDLVFQHLELIEKDYFGLQFAEKTPSTDGMRWLDPSKSIKRQIKHGSPYLLYFRIKFYISNPSKLQEEYTRYHFFLQIKKDIAEGKLIVPPATCSLLASYAVQSELGDYHNDEHKHGYLSQFRFMPGHTEEMERKISELHKLHKGQMPADAEYNFLDHAKRLDMYGVELHKARIRDSTNAEIQLGVSSVGLLVFQNNFKKNTFSCGRTEYQTLEEGKRRARLERTFIRSPSKKYARQTVPTISRDEVKSKTKHRTSSKADLNNSNNSHSVRHYESFNNKVQTIDGERQPRKAWSEASQSDE